MFKLRQPISFRRFLTFAAFLILLPFLLLESTQVILSSRLHQRATQLELREMTRLAASALDASLTGWLAELDDGALLEGSDISDPVGTRRILADYLKRHPRTLSLSLLGRDGSVMAQTGDLTEHEILGIADAMELPVTGSQQQAQRSFSGFLHGPGDGEPLIGLTIPIRRAALVEGVLLAVTRSDAFNAILQANDARLGWQTAIIDQHNIVAAHTRSSLVGQPSPYPEFQAAAGEAEPIVRQAAIGGMPLYVVSRHSTVAPWRLVYLASAGALSDQPQYPLRELAVLTLLLALPLTASALLGRYLGRRIGALAEAAKSVSNEVMPPAMVPTGLREIDVVQEALRHAGEAGQERAATRERMYDMEQALHRAQRVESLGQLTAGIAHDFGNLVFTIRGHLELIKRALGNDERVPALVDPPIQLADEAANLICQLSVGIRGKQYKVQQVNVNDLLREVADLLRHVAGRAVQLNLELADDLFDCRLDPTLLKSALLNLVINARNAMRSGGEIRIKSNNLVLEHDAAAAAGLRPGVPYIAVSVADTGIGIAPEVRTRLFEPFFTTREGEAGTGIGLSILYGFVKAADGQVVVDSTVGVGTTFIMYFPAELTPGIPVNSARVTAPVS